MKRRGSVGLILIFAVLGGLLVLFISVPIARMLFSCRPLTLYDTARQTGVLSSIILTLYCSAIATAIALVTGIPLSFLLARRDFPGKALVQGIIDLPVVIPHTAAGVALLSVFGRRFILGSLFSRIGVDFVSSVPGIVVAMLFVSLPFLVNGARAAFEQMDVRLESVARTLGASPTRVFFTVSMPLAWRGIVSGSLMMWARGISEFGAVVILAYHPMIAPTLIYERLNNFGLAAALPVAVILIIICLAVFIVLRMILLGSARRAET
ncbi:MAG: ABC transporter permease [Planctomycetia bacterium]|nr:ABC transporter permease [Planctomycetia bacterium]